MKKIKLKSSPAFKQGFKDADILVKTGLSIWAMCSLSCAWGFRKKDPKNSHKKLYRYCEGFAERVEKYAKSKGVEVIYNAWNAGAPSQEDIGK